MAQTLRINEKEYLPSTELAKRFSYTSDYISKLAREEKVLATRVGRQWFIEPESLHIYVQQLEIEKKINQEKLSRQRKIERGQGTPLDKKHTPKAANAFALASVVMLLGSMVGVLGWGVVASGLTSQDLARGASAMLVSIEDRLSVGVSVLVRHEVVGQSVASPLLVQEQARIENSGLRSLEEVGPQIEHDGVYATFPSVSLGTTTVGQVLGEQVVGISFSDEVVITTEEDAVYVQPVLRSTVGEPYRIGSTDTTNRSTNN